MFSFLWFREWSWKFHALYMSSPRFARRVGNSVGVKYKYMSNLIFLSKLEWTIVNGSCCLLPCSLTCGLDLILQRFWSTKFLKYLWVVVCVIKYDFMCVPVTGLTVVCVYCGIDWLYSWAVGFGAVTLSERVTFLTVNRSLFQLLPGFLFKGVSGLSLVLHRCFLFCSRGICFSSLKIIIYSICPLNSWD